MTDMQSLLPVAPDALPAAPQALAGAVETYLAGRSAHTQRAYRARLSRFITWYAREAPQGSLVGVLRAYTWHLQQQGLSARSVQVHLSTIKGFLGDLAAQYPSSALALQMLAINRVRPPTVRGQLQGRRLTVCQRQTLINAPGVDSHRGRRDTAILALLAVLGLRRSEACGLRWRHIDELEGHKVIRDMAGKHGRVRTVKLPVPLWRFLVRYAELAGLPTGSNDPVFVRIRKGDRPIPGAALTENAIAFLVAAYAKRALPFVITPHDLRRTAGALARKGGAAMEQVQLMLGHASPQTTSQYIGAALDLDDHAVDRTEVYIPEI